MRTLRKVAALGTSHLHTMQTTDRCEVSRQITSRAPSTCIRLDKVAWSLLGKPGSNYKLRGFLSFLSAVRNVCANITSMQSCAVASPPSSAGLFCMWITDLRSILRRQRSGTVTRMIHTNALLSQVT